MQQEASSVAYSLNVEKPTTVTLSVTAEISSEVEIKIPYTGSVKFGFKLSGTTSVSKSQSETFTITAPSQKVTLAPYTRVNVTFHF